MTNENAPKGNSSFTLRDIFQLLDSLSSRQDPSSRPGPGPDHSSRLSPSSYPDEALSLDGTPYPEPYDRRSEDLIGAKIDQGNKDMDLLAKMAKNYHDAGNFGAEGEHRELMRLLVTQSDQLLDLVALDGILAGREKIDNAQRWSALAKDLSNMNHMIRAIGDMIAGHIITAPHGASEPTTTEHPEPTEPLQDPFEHIQHIFQPAGEVSGSHLSFCGKQIPHQYTLGMSAEEERVLLRRPLCIDCYPLAVAYIRQDERAKILKEQGNHDHNEQEQ